MPGYSKLQIAAYNVHSYWNMFDLLTFTPPPPSLPLPLSSATSASSSYVTTPNRRKCSTSTLEAQKEEEKKRSGGKLMTVVSEDTGTILSNRCMQQPADGNSLQGWME